MADGDAPHDLPVEERAERADPRLIAERGERLADAHHVRLGDADVQRPALIDGGDARLEAAGRREIRIDRDDARVTGKDLHRGGDDVARGVFLRGIEARQQRGVVADALVAQRGALRSGRGRSLTRARACRSRGARPGSASARRIACSVSCSDAASARSSSDWWNLNSSDPFLALRRLQRQLLLDQRLGNRDLVLVQEVGERAVPLHAVADDRRRLPVARPEPELLERGIHALVLRGVDAVHLPGERREDRLELRHREDHAVGDVELAVVAVDHHAQVVQVLLAGVHHRFPDRSFLQLAVARQAEGIEPRRRPAGDGKTLRHAEALPHRTGREVHAGQESVRDGRSGCSSTSASCEGRIDRSSRAPRRSKPAPPPRAPCSA